MKQLFDPLFIPDKGEITEDLLSYKNIQIRRIVSSDDLEKSTFRQSEAEWVTLLAGYAEIQMEDKKYILQKGNSLFIPPLKEHTILKVQKGTIWLAIHIYAKE